MKNIFELETETTIPSDNSYIKSYPALLNYFKGIDHFDGENVVCGSHMIYGWMPTILDLYSEPPNIDASQAAKILDGVKTSGQISDGSLELLVRLINNSLVGTSKLLHFISPNNFAI